MAEAQPDMWYDRSPLLDDRHGRALINGVTKEVDIFLKSYKRAKGANDAGYFSTANEDRKRVIVACGRLVELRPKFELRNQLIFDTVVDSTNKALEKHPVFPMPLNNNADALENFCQRIQARRSSSAAGVPEVGCRQRIRGGRRRRSLRPPRDNKNYYAARFNIYERRVTFMALREVQSVRYRRRACRRMESPLIKQ